MSWRSFASTVAVVLPVGVFAGRYGTAFRSSENPRRSEFPKPVASDPMSNHQPVFVVFNPAAGRGRGGQYIASYLSLLRRYVKKFDYAVTEHAGHEVDLTDKALSSGYKSIVAVGGDGTWSIVADRIVRYGSKDVTLGMLPAGTGNDFGKSLGIRFQRREAAVRAIAAGHRKTIDVGRVEGRHFLNLVGFGFDIAVIDDAANLPVLKGDVVYRFCALRQLFRFRGIQLTLSAGDAPPLRRDHLMLVIANASYFGGSFHIAPRASLEDGKLDAVSIYNAGPISRARLFSQVAKGKHEGRDKVSIQQGSGFRVEFEQPVRYEVDGEVHASSGNSVQVECVPGALTAFIPSEQ